ASTSDGGCYILWFDNRVPNYKVYLQRMDAVGRPLFGVNGMLISSNAQNSSLQDFNIDVDPSGNAVIVFTDSRNTILNPFAYLVNPAGVSLWGPNGIALTDSTNISQNIPVVAATSDGNYVFAWTYGSGPTRLAMQKLNSAGVPQWNLGSPIKLKGTGAENFNLMRLVKSDAGSVIMSWDAYSGNLVTTSTIKIFIQKFSSTGAIQWTSPQDTVQNLGRVSGIGFIPYLVSDGQNGAVICWVDDRDANSRQSVWTQRFNSSGAIQFPKNGAEGSLLSTNNHFSPSVTFLQSTGETVMLWHETNGGQTIQGGLYGQKFNSSGISQWGSSGIEFKPLDNNQLSFISAYSKDSNVVVSYTESIFASANAEVKAMKTGPSGTIHWPGNIVTVSSASGSKIRKQAILDKNTGNSVMTWSNGDIIAQNIRFSGELGVIAIDLKIAIEGFWNSPLQVSDTVICYLQNSVTPYNTIDMGKTFLNTNGEGTVYFVTAATGTYYLKINHRNSIETWSGSPVVLINGINSYDFTTSASQAFGNNLILKDGRYSVYSGDVNQDGIIDGADASIADNDASNFITGYAASDVNGDNIVDGSDLAIIDNNASNFIGVSRP
ncbi:MAG: dockerin type I repeat-containing protein, partial [Ignavibacteria bacterium]